MPLPPPDQLLASAVHYLIQGDQKDTALVLLFCEADYVGRGTLHGVHQFALCLTGPRVAYEAFRKSEQRFDDMYSIAYSVTPVADCAKEAVDAVTPSGFSCEAIEIRVQLVDVENGWREELREIANGRRVHNQGVDIPGREIYEWGNMRFRSQAEVRVAKALDAAGVLFLPNCLSRLNAGDGRVTKEADFLVCAGGKWGILEVDGPFHPRAATDHERDRLFQLHGIKVTERFDAEKCYRDAPTVVQRFLTLLDRNG